MIVQFSEGSSGCGSNYVWSMVHVHCSSSGSTVFFPIGIIS